MEPLSFNQKRALNAVLYVASRLTDRGYHKIFKVLYFADRDHLADWGRTITGDRYVAMEFGPVPSVLYDIFKAKEEAAGNGAFANLFLAQRVDPIPRITPLVDADRRVLSRSDIKALDKALNEYGGKDFETIKTLSHGPAWDKTPRNRPMSFFDIMKEHGETDEYARYADEQALLQTIPL